MTTSRTARRVLAVSVGLAVAVVLLAASIGQADSAPIGPLPPGPVASTTTKPGLLVAVALSACESQLRAWCGASRGDTTPASFARSRKPTWSSNSVVLVFKVVGRGDTSLVFALTRGDTSSKAVRSATHRIHSA